MGFFLGARLVSKTILETHSKAKLFAKFQIRTKKIFNVQFMQAQIFP